MQKWGSQRKYSKGEGVPMTQGRKDHQQRIPNQSTYIYGWLMFLTKVSCRKTHGRSVLMRTVYLIQLIISKGEKAQPTSRRFMRTSLFVSSSDAFTIGTRGIGVTPISSFFSRCWYFCPLKYKRLKSSGEKWTEQITECLDAVQFFREAFTKEIHFRLLLTASGLGSLQNGIVWIEMPFFSSFVLLQPYTTHFCTISLRITNSVVTRKNDQLFEGWIALSTG